MSDKANNNQVILDKANKDFLNKFIYKFETHINPLKTTFNGAIDKMAADITNAHSQAVDAVKKARKTAKKEQLCADLVEGKVYPDGKAARDTEVRQMWARNLDNAHSLEACVQALQPAFDNVNRILDKVEELNRKYQADKTEENKKKLYFDLPLVSTSVSDLQKKYVDMNEKLVSNLKQSLTTALPRNTMFRVNYLVDKSHDVAASLAQSSEKLLHAVEGAITAAQNTNIQSVSGKTCQLASKMSENLAAANFDLQDLEELARSLDILGYSHDD